MIRAAPALGVLAVSLAAACGGADRRPAAEDSTPAAPPARMPDTLVLTTPDGYEVWLTDVRAASDSTGAACIERSVEIRRDTLRLRVPLFYTRSAPTVLDRRHLRGELSRDCATMAVYRIETATARPYRIEAR